MLQWMGGSRRKVTTSRKSTQTRQRQYFEQRKRRQQLTSGSETCQDAVDAGREQKEHRSLDILSLLNLSTIPLENKTAYTIGASTSTVQSHFMQDPTATLYNIETLEKSAEFVNKQYNDVRGAPSGYKGEGAPSGYKGEPLSPLKHVCNDLDNQNNAKNEVDSQSDQGMTSVEQNLSIFDLLGDDGMVGNSIGSPMNETHVAFSVEGLGRVGMETPACSPQHTSRSFSYGFSPQLKSMQPWNSSKNIKVLDDLELEVDIMMQDIKKYHDDGALNYSIGMMDTSDNVKKQSPAKTSFQSVEDCKRNEHYGSKSIFDGMDGGRDRLDGGFGFLNNDFLGEMECDFFEKNHFNQIDSDSSDFLKYEKYDISEIALSPYVPKKRGAGAARTMDQFNLYDPARSSSKHHTLGYDDYDLMSDAERKSKATRLSNFKDKSLQPDWFCSMADDATDNFSLLSEESCSSSAVRGEAFNSTPLDSNPRQSMGRGRDGDSGPGNSCSVNSIYSRYPRYKIRDEVNQGDHAHEPGKYARESNSSKSKPVHHSNLPSMEKLQPFKSWSFEKECNLSSLCQNPGTDRPFRGVMPWSGDPCAESALPESSFINKRGETVPRPSRSSISKRFSFEPSNMESGALKHDLCSNSKLVGTYTGMAEAISSHGEDAISPVLSAQGSVGKGEKSESKVSSFVSEKVDFQKEKCTGSKEIFADDRDWFDDSNYENKNCDSISSETENGSPIGENLEASHYSDHAEKTQPLSMSDKTGSANEDKYNHDDKVSVPCSKGEKEVKDVKPEGRKTRSKSCSIDSSSQVMMLESYVLQLLFVQKVLRQASSQDFMKNA